MAKAPHQSTARIPLSKAPERACEQLGVADRDYAKMRLREVLSKAVLGRDWGAQAVYPPDTRIDGLWGRGAWWEVHWDRERADKLGLMSDGYYALPGKLVPVETFAVGLWIAPAVIAALQPIEADPHPADPLIGTELWVYNYMVENPPRKGDRTYIGRVYKESRKFKMNVKKKTIQTYVGKYRKELGVP